MTGTVTRGREFLDDKRSLIQSAVDMAGKEAYQREKTKGAPEA